MQPFTCRTLWCRISQSVIFVSTFVRWLAQQFDTRMQLLFAFSPLLALGYILMTAFESDTEEKLKRKKKTDFQLEGHAE